jgi:hypothetical protein
MLKNATFLGVPNEKLFTKRLAAGEEISFPSTVLLRGETPSGEYIISSIKKVLYSYGNTKRICCVVDQEGLRFDAMLSQKFSDAIELIAIAYT